MPPVQDETTRRGNYESGADYVLEYGELRFSFNERDFAQRVEQAAVKLDFVRQGLDEHELEDLLELAVNGEIREPCSPLGEHVNENWDELVGPSNKSLVHWMRRLVFRGAWLDQRVKEGELDIVFDERSQTFGYVQPDRDSELIELSAEPSWAEQRLRRPHWPEPTGSAVRGWSSCGRSARPGRGRRRRAPSRRARLAVRGSRRALPGERSSSSPETRDSATINEGTIPLAARSASRRSRAFSVVSRASRTSAPRSSESSTVAIIVSEPAPSSESSRPAPKRRLDLRRVAVAESEPREGVEDHDDVLA